MGISIRPNLNEFLREFYNKFELIAFTAGDR
jgi:hypothetical protein